MKKLTDYIKKYWLSYLFAVACMVTAIGLDMLFPMITKTIVDEVLKKGKMELLKGCLMGILLIGIGRCVTGYAKEYTFDIVSSKIARELRKDLFSHIQRLSMSYFVNTNTGTLMARVKDDIDAVWAALGYVGMLILEIIIHTVIVIYCMLRLSPGLTIIPLIVMPIMGTCAIFMERRLNKIYEEISEENAKLNTVAEENLAGVRTVKAFAREKFEIQKFLSHNSRYYELNMQQSKALAKYQPYFQFAGKLIPMISVVIGGVFVIRGEITLGTLVAFQEYSRNIVWPMETIGWVANDFSAAVASYKKIRRIFKEVPEIKEPENGKELKNPVGDITFDKVSFCLEEKEILKDISFHVAPGKTLGIMGATGAGKSSIINLLERFYDVTEGKILFDGEDIRDISLKSLRGSMALVMQDVFLFSDTIEENIKMGKRCEVDAKRIQEAARFAQADDFIGEMEEKYSTVVGERGVGLSGGQKQRISIARAVAKRTPVLIMDDSTSALDMETEHQIQRELKGLTGTTKLIIAHRISAVRHADEILILKEGQIAERGTHEELLERKGLYYETYKAQYGSYQEVIEGWQ
ncbi:ABC transporter ATP-binding protein [Acetivibrio ethanolgignens]|uniref:ABC transporter n=1 Tax=Acetivibrio ethanolgignens TaxID=290052 RepID=A0A0V8QIF0_9FIRM|nr:ABC transporter ATP-binding protein [Acetivibrio ethanolgignens]KSV60022.1 ABC transporter [Acetivibrio ethanolgignens]